MTTKVSVSDDVTASTLEVAKPATAFMTYNVKGPSQPFLPILVQLVGGLPSDLTSQVTFNVLQNDGKTSVGTASVRLYGDTHWPFWPSTVMFVPKAAQPDWIGILFVGPEFFTSVAVTWSNGAPKDPSVCYASTGGKTGSWPSTGGLNAAEVAALKFVLADAHVQTLLKAPSNQAYLAGIQSILKRVPF